MFMEVFASGPLETNCAILACSKTLKCAIIDAPYQSLEVLPEILERLHLIPQMLLLTHSHWDHIAEARAIQEKYKIPVYIHKKDAGNLRSPGEDKLPLFFHIPPLEPDFFVKEGEVIELGLLKIDVIHTPGHSPGGVCYFLKEQGLLFSGDTLFRGGIGSLSLPTANPGSMFASLKKLAILPLETRVMPGHGGETTIKREYPSLIYDYEKEMS